MTAMARRPHTNDLFALFPDLPWTRMRQTQALLDAMRTRVAAARARAIDNIRRQREATERVQSAISARRRRR
jgi:hypothetical protein